VRNPIYRCPHCHEKVELELTKSGQILLHVPSKHEDEWIDTIDENVR